MFGRTHRAQKRAFRAIWNDQAIRRDFAINLSAYGARGAAVIAIGQMIGFGYPKDEIRKRIGIWQEAGLLNPDPTVDEWLDGT